MTCGVKCYTRTTPHPLVTARPETQDPYHRLSAWTSELVEYKTESDIYRIGLSPDVGQAWFIERHRDLAENIELDSYNSWMGITKDGGSTTTEPEKLDEWPTERPWIPPPQ